MKVSEVDIYSLILSISLIHEIHLFDIFSLQKFEFYPVEDFDCTIEIIQSESKYTTLRSFQAIETHPNSNTWAI